MSRSKETFRPRDKHEVKIFTCGPSIYRRPHIGNYRTFLYEDILVKYLTYKGFKVDRIINFTDVEDKTISEAEDKHLKMKQLTKEVASHFFSETKLLRIKLPPVIPSSSTSVPQAVKIIQQLIKKGYAYWHDGDVFFDPLKKKDFGKLYRLDMTKWPKKKVRFKHDTYNGNRWNRGDFVLWHGYHEGDIAFWDTEIGRGRPSWNIQDPAMITEHLGLQVDINCGGIDNIYRHHDYNIAVIESLSGKSYANYYLHGEHLIVNGKKMSKSVGNILYPDELVEEGHRPEHLRFFLTATKHYRQKLNFTRAKFEERAALLEEVRALVKRLTAKGGPAKGSPEADALVARVVTDFELNMEDDLSLAKAFAAVTRDLKALEKLAAAAPLSAAQRRTLEQNLRKIDAVFDVLF